jgi:hypothetical protein
VRCQPRFTPHVREVRELHGEPFVPAREVPPKCIQNLV